MAESFQDSRVVITGAAGGIGSALCHKFVSEGARVVAVDRVATAVVDGLRKRKRLVLPGATARTAYWTWRVAPGLYERLMRSRVG